MKDKVDSLEQIKDIHSMMERSSRFIGLSGWSGISAGLCALLGAFWANHRIDTYYQDQYLQGNFQAGDLLRDLLLIAVIVFITALALAVLFTYRKSHASHTPFWSHSSKRLLWNTFLPMLVGGIFILKLIAANQYSFVAPACLLFYGLGLINGSKYTLGEIRYLGYSELIIGLLNLLFPTQPLLFWALGFGLLHIIYGFIMWWTYDKKGVEQ